MCAVGFVVGHNPFCVPECPLVSTVGLCEAEASRPLPSIHTTVSSQWQRPSHLTRPRHSVKQRTVRDDSESCECEPGVRTSIDYTV